MKCNQPRSGFELVSLCPFPMTITIKPQTPNGTSPWCKIKPHQLSKYWRFEFHAIDVREWLNVHFLGWIVVVHMIGQPESPTWHLETFSMGLVKGESLLHPNQWIWKNLNTRSNGLHAMIFPGEISWCSSWVVCEVSGEWWCPYWILNKTPYYTRYSSHIHFQ